jgi:hypothetical protein
VLALRGPLGATRFESPPNGGFLAPPEWSVPLGTAQFSDVRAMPDVARIRDVFATF